MTRHTVKTRLLFLAIVVGLGATACTSPESTVTTSGAQEYPDVVEVDVHRGSDGTYRFVVTVSSPYDSPERYADAWRIRSPGGMVYGIRDLLHDHADEQPFTRSLGGVEIPEDTGTVVVEARDLVNGWGGATMVVDLP